MKYDVMSNIVNDTINVSDVLKGAINQDKAINSHDSILLLRYLARWNIELNGAQMQAADDITGERALWLMEFRLNRNANVGEGLPVQLSYEQDDLYLCNQNLNTIWAEIEQGEVNDIDYNYSEEVEVEIYL